ncbi:MAG: hypothetical protein QM737_16675 [Ferruginibacter sp.]
MPTAQPLPNIFISKEVKESRVNNYLTDKYPLLINAQKEQDTERTETKSIWYSKEHLETWLNELAIMDADGMRIYFGAYNEEESPVAGQLCLLMVLTRETETGHADIVYEDEPVFEERLNASPNFRTITDIDNKVPKQFNYGAPCPPIC